ncbi:MAG: UvrD-helicase domain-containing protein [Planctomycetota bacterium]|nr:UvrD-helicase domain-containing protein [Planctomycetota bacterium]
MSRRHKESPGQGFLFESFGDAAPAAPTTAPATAPAAPAPIKDTPPAPEPPKAELAPPAPAQRVEAPKPPPRVPPATVSVPATSPAQAAAVFDETARREMTPEQREAALLASNRVLSASAGTGKTFTLTEIYLGLLAGTAKPGKPAPLYPSQIVAVTFTEKAAAELRDRVRRELDERLLAERDAGRLAHLRRCREELPGAPISTIHAFCARLLREAGERPGVPAGFAVMEEAESAELLDRALSDTAAEALSAGTASPLRTLAREWGVAPGGEFGLVPAARRLIRTLRTSGKNPDVLAPDLVEQNHRERLEAALAEIYDAIRQAPDKGRSKPPPELRELAEGDPGVGGLESARKRVLAIYYHCTQSSSSKLYKWAEDAGLDGLLEEALSAAHAPYRAALAKYVEAGMAAFRREKLRAGALDFDDLLLEARRLLCEDAEIAHAYAFVLIDEFQDTNPLQKDVLYRVAFPPNGEPDAGEVKLAIVGDVKQSIYRFRGADVRVMAEACDAFDVKPLRRNFRSRRAVIEWINGFCARTLWPPRTDAFSYGERHELEPDPDPRRHAWDGPAGELLARAGEGEQEASAGLRWQQAQAIARRVRALVAPSGGELPRPGIWMRREKRVRPEVKYADVAILARSLKHMRIPLELALGRMGIPFRMLGGVSYYTRPEILDASNLLAWTADPEDSGALLGLLRSPFVQLSDAAVYDLMRVIVGGPGPVERLKTFAQRPPAAWSARDRESLARGAALLEALETRRGTCTAAGLIDLACAQTGFLSVLAMQPQGETAVAAVRRLIEQSREFEARGARTLGDFVELLREKADAEWDDQGAEGGPDLTPDLPESLDAVQIGTVHGAKGLEFPIVVLADMGFERPGGSESALLHDRGVGLRLGSESDGMRARADSIHEWADRLNRQEEDAESRRLLYVALTRACDYLILAGERRRKSGGLWRALIDQHEEAGPALARIPYDHPELLAAREDAGRALVRFEDGRAEVKPPPGPAPAPEAAARIRALLEHATRPPAPVGGVRKAEVSVSEFARFLSCPRRYRYSRVEEDASRPRKACANRVRRSLAPGRAGFRFARDRGARGAGSRLPCGARRARGRRVGGRAGRAGAWRRRCARARDPGARGGGAARPLGRARARAGAGEALPRAPAALARGPGAGRGGDADRHPGPACRGRARRHMAGGGLQAHAARRRARSRERREPAALRVAGRAVRAGGEPAAGRAAGGRGARAALLEGGAA